VSAGALTPGFQSNTISYDVIVSAADSSVTVTAATSNSSATVTIDGRDVASGTPISPIASAAGDNTVTVLVTAEDGSTTRTYTLSVYRLSDDGTLSSLSLSQGGWTRFSSRR
jgi:protease II